MSEKIDKAMGLFRERKYKEAIDAFSCVLETEPDTLPPKLSIIYGIGGLHIPALEILNRQKIFIPRQLS